MLGDYLKANNEAIKNIKEIIDNEKIDCDFEFQNAYVYATKQEDLEKIKQEVKDVNSLGFNANFTTETSLPFDVKGAICFEKQAQFNPLKYVYGLCEKIIELGSNIFVNTVVNDIKCFKNYCITYSGNYRVKSKYVIIASHYPFVNFPGLYFMKMYQATSYLIAVETKENLGDGMYISSSEPYVSFRKAKYENKELLLIGGGGHKTGNAISYQNSYWVLENIMEKYYPNSKVLFRWNTRDCVSLDKVPYVGSYSLWMPNVYVGTGFKKWGMTLSNVAANVIVDSILKKENPYAYLFNSKRLRPVKNCDEFKNMVSQSVKSLVTDKISKVDNKLENIKNNSGGIVEIEGKKVGVYKDSEGKIYAVKPVCTHLGCMLSWNDVDKTWDCPCHGSRFDYYGHNIYDPAFKSLEPYKNL